ncbi:hypothetical protein CANCADRAFT_56438 [Tortispora caseinolytica NRRL Y-17796]|uniref:Protein kinase domain-containing protein n=1 Tax=Tortispora caseinolytica NRRL Y-17796 TaxID=767744 RepID=A0A1E4TMA3_9ASCO|nr:hypothetical protein CANCADRAFT_56438 [Tortispora caseinolytica NRRL Y-17796]
MPLEDVKHGDLTFILHKEIYRSPLSSVYDARALRRHLDIDQRVALKRSWRSPQPHDFRQEAALLSSFSHPNIIRCLHSFIDDEDEFITVMPYIPFTLTTLVQHASGDWNYNPLVHQLLDAVTYIHSQGIIHRDIKPDNILVDGPLGPLYLADFSTAYTSGPKVCDVSTSVYRAPELLFGYTYDQSLDIWQVGCTVAFLALRAPLFTSSANDNISDIQLIATIFGSLGPPTEEDWPEISHSEYMPHINPKSVQYTPIKDLLSAMPTHVQTLVASCLKYSRSHRPTAQSLLSSYPHSDSV